MQDVIPGLLTIQLDPWPACNRLIEQAFAEGCAGVVLVSDRSLVSPAALNALGEVMSRYPNAVVGCRIAEAGRSDHYLLPGRRWSAQDLQWRSEWYIEIKPDPTGLEVYPCDWLDVGAVLIPRRVWDGVGRFESQIPTHLALIDWCLRVRKLGFDCLELQAPVVVVDPSSLPDQEAAGADEFLELPGLLLLARRHGLPMGFFRLAWRLLSARVGDELGKVRFGTDYGQHVSPVKRTIWYLANLLSAARRARIPAFLSVVLRHSGQRHWRGRPP